MVRAGALLLPAVAVTLAACGLVPSSQPTDVASETVTSQVVGPLAREQPATPWVPSPTAVSGGSGGSPSPQPTAATSAPQEPAVLVGRFWGRTFTSVAVTQGGQDHPLLEGTAIRLAFEQRVDGGVARWWSGCNTDGAWVVITPDRLDLDEATYAGTTVACDEARHEQDRWTSAFLLGDPAWSFEGETLVLWSGETTIRFERSG